MGGTQIKGVAVVRATQCTAAVEIWPTASAASEIGAASLTATPEDLTDGSRAVSRDASGVLSGLQCVPRWNVTRQLPQIS